MSQNPRKNITDHEHEYNTRRKRTQVTDKNRNTSLPVPVAQVPKRKDLRESIRGRPLSNNHLPAIPETNEQDLSSESNNPKNNSSEIQNFAIAGGMENLAAGFDPNAVNNSQPPSRGSVSQPGAIPKVTNTSNVQNQTAIPPTNDGHLIDPAAMTVIKEVIANTQKHMMDDIISNLTNTFKETLQLEAAKIASQVRNNFNQPPNNPPVSSNRPGDESRYRLDYREDRYCHNQANFQSNSHTYSNPNSNPQAQQVPPRNNTFSQPIRNCPSASHNPNGGNYFQQPREQNPFANEPNFNHHAQQNFAQQPHDYAPNYYNQNRLRIDKWGISFNGTNMAVEDFLFRVELKQNRSGCTWQEVYDNLNSILKDPVDSWYWDFRKKNPRADFDSFKCALSERYPTKDTDIDFWKKLINRKQKHGETFDDFVDDLERLYFKMEAPPTNAQFISVIRDNVIPEISTYIGLARPNTLIEMKYLAREAEKLVDKLKPNKSNFFKKNVNEVSDDDRCCNEDEHMFIEAFTTQKRDYKVFQCKKCSQKFRVNEETREEKRIYCYGCGKEGVVVTNCPVCLENKKASE